ncbi:MAG: tRNA pseudouridine(55) synthase TruB [Finegoldia sp.]|nr:tRNA pseudouridine(55) synthase TruB [Finegoldia sp.]
MDAIFNIFKEKGFTSNDVVSICKKIFNTGKVGHAGTLDPDATGVLLVGVGKGTKLTEYLMEYGKTYIFQMQFGLATDTLDLSGKVIAKSKSDYDKDKLLEILNDLRGKTISQVPPMYSAIKIKGKRLYEYARENIEVERKAREVTIYDINPIYLLENSAIIKVKCSKGTYIRSLVADIAKDLNRCAYMKSLIRVESAGFKIEDSIKLESLKKLSNFSDVSYSLYDSLSYMDSIDLDNDLYKKVSNGSIIYLKDKDDKDLVRVSCDDKFIGVGEIKQSKLKMKKVFNV